jgi:hypothetical protein
MKYYFIHTRMTKTKKDCLNVGKNVDPPQFPPIASQCIKWHNYTGWAMSWQLLSLSDRSMQTRYCALPTLCMDKLST